MHGSQPFNMLGIQILGSPVLDIDPAGLALDFSGFIQAENNIAQLLFTEAGLNLNVSESNAIPVSLNELQYQI